MQMARLVLDGSDGLGGQICGLNDAGANIGSAGCHLAVAASVHTDLDIVVGANTDTDTGIGNGYTASANNANTAGAITDHTGGAVVTQGIDD